MLEQNSKEIKNGWWKINGWIHEHKNIHHTLIGPINGLLWSMDIRMTKKILQQDVRLWQEHSWIIPLNSDFEAHVEEEKNGKGTMGYKLVLGKNASMGVLTMSMTCWKEDRNSVFPWTQCLCDCGVWGLQNCTTDCWYPLRKSVFEDAECIARLHLVSQHRPEGIPSNRRL